MTAKKKADTADPRLSREETLEQTRPSRTPLYQVKKTVLNAEARPGYYRRVINDVVGRVQKFIEAGYSIVKPNGQVWEATVNTDKDASANKGYLVEIPMDIYKEDEAAKALLVDETEDRINPKKRNQGGEDFGYMKKE